MNISSVNVNNALSFTFSFTGFFFGKVCSGLSDMG